MLLAVDVAEAHGTGASDRPVQPGHPESEQADSDQADGEQADGEHADGEHARHDPRPPGAAGAPGQRVELARLLADLAAI
jgi:hypothetical protein